MGSANTAWTNTSTVTTNDDAYQNPFIGKSAYGSMLPQYGTPSVVANDDSLNSAITKIDTKVGANAVPVARTNNPIVGANPVQSNLSKLDSAIGTDLANTNYAKNNQTVNQNISALDGQTKTNTDAISSLQSGQRWITPMRFITSENLTARSGLAQFIDDQTPYTLPVAGDRVVSTYDKKLYIASATAWGAGVALATNDTFFVDNDLLATVDINEKTSVYNFNGTTIVRSASIDFETATTIALSATYTPATGNPVPSDSVESAIGKIDGNVDALTSAMGVAQGNTNLGAVTGTGATRLLTATETAKSALQKIANDNGGTAGGSGDYTSNQSINANINAIDAVLTEAHKRIAVNNISTDTLTTIDTLDMSGNIRFVEWDVTLIQSTTPANRYSCKLRAIASTGGNDSTEYAILTIGSTIANVALSVDSTTLNATTLKVQATVTGGFHAKIVRRMALIA